jgi:transcriptional regulator with XRE-family HTH domain
MIDFDKMAVARAIYKLRQEKDLSQEVFSGLAGLARSHIAMIENGTKQPNFETIWRIANAFDLAPHELVERIEREAENNDK